MKIRSRLLPLLLVAAATACGPAPKDGPIVVSIIGNPPKLANPDREQPGAPSAALLNATAQGLVGFDSAGQIEPGLAIRWDVSDDGLYYTFRLNDQSELSAQDAVRRLRAVTARGSRNPFKPLLQAVEEIIAVTPEVVEIRLAAPQPDLLELLAQPELAIVRGNTGSGPLLITADPAGIIRLRSPVETERDSARSDEILLRGERAAVAVTRFAIGQATLVMGGSFADLPLVRAAKLPEGVLRFDPVAGLFGFAVVDTNGFLADPRNRRALSTAIDRGRITTLIGVSGLTATGKILARSTRSPAGRDATLIRTKSAIRHRLRIAMPDGPGADMLFRLVSADWTRIGVDSIRVGIDAPADLRLIDQVPPSADDAWPLRRLGCDFMSLCSKDADAAVSAASALPAGPARQARLAAASAYLESLTPFIPITQPVRWSLLATRVEGWQENSRAVHPLHHLKRSAGWAAERSGR